MSIENEGIAPDSLEAQALAELQAEGNEIKDHQPVNDEGESEEQPKETPKETPKEEPKEDPVEPRTPTMVEAWKLKVAEDQKASAVKQVEDLQARLEELSKQKSPVTDKQTEDITDEIRAIAEESGVDSNFLEKFANTIIKKSEAKNQIPSDIAETIQNLRAEQELARQEKLYQEEFIKDIEPLVKEQYGLSDTALSKLRSQLKDMAFSETYAKVPLAKILKAELDSFELKEAKRSSEGKGIKVRSNEVVDMDNLTEDQLDNLTPEQLEQFEARHTSGWKRPK